MNAGKPPSRDWRAEPPAPSLYAREWRGYSRESGKGWSRRSKLRLVGLGLSVLVGLIVYLLAPVADRVPATQIVTFGIGAYGGRANPQGNMPLNPFGEQDARAFDTLSQRNPDQFPPVRQEANALNSAQFMSFLKSEAESPALSGRHLIVFCTLHGLVQPSGEIELFAIDASPDSPSSSSGAMIPLADLMARLQASSARRVLLVLDASRLDSNWRLGILANDVPAELAAIWPPQSSASKSSPGGNPAKVAILLAAAPGQQSWVGDGQSAVVRFVIDGLAGSADGWVDTSGGSAGGPKDSRVSLQELTAYTRRQVHDWVRQRFGATQDVQLLGNVTDFDLAIVSPPPVPVESDKSPAKEAAEKTADVKAAATSPDTETAKVDAAATAKAPSTEAPKVAAAPEVKWDVRLPELWKERDRLRDSTSAEQQSPIARMPLTWRAWESQLILSEALRRGGMEELVPPTVRKADALVKRLQGGTESIAGVEPSANENSKLTLEELGFSKDATRPSREALAEAAKYLQGLIPDPNAPPAVTPRGDAGPEQETRVVLFWLQQELLRDRGPQNWGVLRQIVEQLQRTGKFPLTPDTLLLRDVLSAEDGPTRLGTGDSLERIFALRQRFRRIVVDSPESFPLIHEVVTQGLRDVNAAERWLLATSSNRPEIRSWLEKGEQAAADAEAATDRYLTTLGIWSELLVEQPGYATWIATRANDDDKRPVEWTRLRELVRQWSDRERDGRWEVEPLRSAWPDRPERWTELERLLLVQFIDVQRLKRALLPSSGADPAGQVTADFLAELSREAVLHRREFRDAVSRSLPRLGTASAPSPMVWQDAARLLNQPWLTSEERRDLEALVKMPPRGDVLGDRSAETGSLWQAFWAIATLSLYSTTPEQTETLWKDWDRLAELSLRPSGASEASSSSEESALRRRRADLGRAIRQQWSDLQSRISSDRSEASVPAWIMRAATLDPTLLPEVDPDVHIRSERQRQFANWLAVFATDWRRYGRASESLESLGADSPLSRAESLARELGGAITDAALPIPPRFREVDPPAFSADRKGRLGLSVSAVSGGPQPLVLLSGANVRLTESPGQNLAVQSATRPLPEGGELALDLKLDDDVESTRQLLAVLTEADGFPLDFREVPLQPPFDPRSWRIEFVESKSLVPLQTMPMSKPAGAKLFLPPSASFSLQAILVRPAKDSTASAKITIYQLTESGRVSLAEGIGVPLEPGKERTAINLDLPPAPPPNQPAAVAVKEVSAAEPIADLARGWLFEITPEGQRPLEYLIRPTFWSASRFLNEPRPVIDNDRFVLNLERHAASADDVLLPQKIPVELRIPPALKKPPYILSGSAEFGQQLTLSFAMPPNWRDQIRDKPWDLALDVAGLPHAYRWQINSSGNIEPVTGQPPRVAISVLLPAPPDPKTPARLELVVKNRDEPLHLRFAVDATAIDRTEETGDWILEYTVLRETESGAERTPLSDSWRLFSSLDKHVFLEGIKAGVWNLKTAARDYERIEEPSQIQGISGRFQVQAALLRPDQPQLPIASARERFAIDDDSPPTVELKGPTKPQLITRDLSFRILATDQESGITRIAYGFDKNGDREFQEQEEALGEKMFVGLDNPVVDWPVVIDKSDLPTIEKDEESRRLLVKAWNNLGPPATESYPVNLRKPAKAAPSKAKKGQLVVTFAVSRGANATIQYDGPESDTKKTTEGTTTLSLDPGKYKITVNVNYPVIGVMQAGEATAEVKAGESKTVEVNLKTSK